MKINLLTTLKQIFITTLIAFSTAASSYAQTATPDDSIYQGLGKQEGITKIVNDFVPLILADARIAHFFSRMNKEQFTQLLSDQFCELAGGPCHYKGRDMYTTHDGMAISNAHFNALAEDLQIAMEKNDISTSVANRLVAKLAPMQRPIVSK